MIKTHDFYLASPFFNPEQVERVNYVNLRLRDLGYKVWSPSHDGTVVSPREGVDIQKRIFELNCLMIKRSNYVFAITDGKDIGTIWECGYAYAKNVPIVYFAETLNGPFNLMLAQSGIKVISTRYDIDNTLLDSRIFKGEIE